MSGQETIPRILHYCWFGRGPKPKKIVKCMKSWKKHLSDYKWIEWNEDNFNILQHPYVRQAYEARKFAFVSDYVRLYALHRYGGIYLDTDVEVLRPLDRFLRHEAFSGFEDEVYLQSGTMGAVPEHPWIKELLEYYKDKPFVRSDGTFDMTTNTHMMTKLCSGQGLVANGRYQRLENGIVFYPRTFFSSYDYINGKSFLTEESYTIHHFAQSWLPPGVRLRSRLKRTASRIVGPKSISWMRKLIQNR